LDFKIIIAYIHPIQLKYQYVVDIEDKPLILLLPIAQILIKQIICYVRDHKYYAQDYLLFGVFCDIAKYLYIHWA